MTAKKLDDDTLQRFRERARSYLARNGLLDRSTLQIRTRGRWLVLAGRVPRQRNKTRLIGLAPEQDGKQFVVDRLRVDAQAGVDS